MKKTVLLVSLFLLILTVASPAYAKKNDHNDVSVQNAYRDTGSGLQELSKDELSILEVATNNAELAKSKAAETNNQAHPSTVTTATVTPDSVVPPKNYYYKYRQIGYISAVTRSGERARNSIYVCNCTNSSFPRDISFSSSVSYSVNISLSASYKSAISATLGASWQETYQYSDTVHPMTNPLTRNWTEFTPIKDNSYGYMDYIENDFYTGYSEKIISSEWVDLYLARTMNGHADGILYTMDGPAQPGDCP